MINPRQDPVARDLPSLAGREAFPVVARRVRINRQGIRSDGFGYGVLKRS